MRTKLAAGIMTILSVAIIGGAGVAAASASPGGIRAEHLRIMNTKATANRLSVIATGAFTAGGYVIPAAVTDTVVFPGGTFKFRHVTHSGTASFNSSTCLLPGRDCCRRLTTRTCLSDVFAARMAKSDRLTPTKLRPFASALRAIDRHGDGPQLPRRPGHRKRDAGPVPDHDGAEVGGVFPAACRQPDTAAKNRQDGA